MRLKSTLFILLFLFIKTTIGFSQEKQIVYENPKDTLHNLYCVYKPKTEIKAVLILLPGYYEMPYHVDQETNIPMLAANNGILTIIPTFSEGVVSFFLSETYQTDLKNFIKKMIKTYHLENKKLIIGGFSLGGSGAVKYTELSYQYKNRIQPIGVFAIDSPLDMERLYMSMLNMQKKGIQNDENNYFIKRIEKEIGSTPEKNRKLYWNFSPYSYNDTTQTAIQSLKNIPVRMYTEPDIQWQIKNRSRSFYDMNSMDGSALINDLKILGNKNAELITTTEKGYRKSTNQRNPHAWSIVDSNELINWIQKIIQ